MKTLIFLATGLFLLTVGITSCQKDNDLLAESQAIEASLDQKTDDISPWGIDPDPNPWSVDPLNNYPNPFENATTIRFQVKQRARVSLVVYSRNSRKLTYLLNSMLNAGTYKEVFDASGMPAGIYFARLRIGNKVFTEKMIKIRDTAQDDGSAH